MIDQHRVRVCCLTDPGVHFRASRATMRGRMEARDFSGVDPQFVVQTLEQYTPYTFNLSEIEVRY
jgi:hypothetical protein